ncbi:MAG: hypothetical protein PUJ25_03690, partial [Lachnospiraceae bacterium]|nr:hypothetical protein [Lachnospiraceae bacterium]MDD7664682.1 hypothetical protein [Lachnospiraceae bacterium]MDY4165114.1 hypothetical protein [Lachnospiraceae bacterium]
TNFETCQISVIHNFCFLAVIETFYDDFREDVNTMCNLAEGIEERAAARTREEDRKKAEKVKGINETLY